MESRKSLQSYNKANKASNSKNVDILSFHIWRLKHFYFLCFCDNSILIRVKYIGIIFFM
jgi:hypothetical protein